MFECIVDVFLCCLSNTDSGIIWHPVFYSCLFSLIPCFQKVTFSPLSFLYLLHTCSALGLPFSPWVRSLSSICSLISSSVFGLPLLPRPPPLHTIQLCNHIIKQHYCICNYVWIISRWTAFTALNSFSVSPLSIRGELVLFQWDEWRRGESMVY